MIEQKHDLIFLQVCDDEDSEWCGDVTWCQDRIHEDDVEYIRADIVAEQLAAKDAEIERLKEQYRSFAANGYAYRDESLAKEKQLAAKDAEIEEESQLRERLSDILSRTAVALKGPNEELSLHSWHDLPEKAEELQQQLAAKDAEIASLLGYCETVDGLRTIAKSACNNAWVEIEDLEQQLSARNVLLSRARDAFLQFALRESMDDLESFGYSADAMIEAIDKELEK
jgi:hypothetical protein